METRLAAVEAELEESETRENSLRIRLRAEQLVDHLPRRERIHRPVRHSRRSGALVDLAGPKIRLGKFQGGSLQVMTGESVVVTTRELLGHGHIIPTPVRCLRVMTSLAVIAMAEAVWFAER